MFEEWGLIDTALNKRKQPTTRPLDSALQQPQTGLQHDKRDVGSLHADVPCIVHQSSHKKQHLTHYAGRHHHRPLHAVHAVQQA